MRKRKYGILSLDVSSQSTGWSFSVKDRVCAFGVIKIKDKDPGKRLVYFRRELGGIIDAYSPSHTVIEDGWAGSNIATLKTLCEFSGVAKELLYMKFKDNAYVANNKTTKAHFGVKTKEELFEEIIRIYGWEDRGLKFKEFNDITDAVAQSVCFFERVLGGHQRRAKLSYEYDEGLFEYIMED